MSGLSNLDNDFRFIYVVACTCNHCLLLLHSTSLFYAIYYCRILCHILFIHLPLNGQTLIDVLIDILFFNLFILFAYFWLHCVFIAACRLSLAVASRGYSLLRCMVFSLRWLLLLCSTDSRCTGFSSCDTRAQ